jgi:hypothetical protein
MTRKKQAKDAARPAKRPYREPKLTRHGDLKTLTMSKGGNRTDGGGAPKTRMTAAP